MSVENYEIVLAGWTAASEEMRNPVPCGGWVVSEVDMLVRAQGVENGTCLGAPVMAWVWRSTLSRIGNQTCVITSKERFSGANRHVRGSHRTLALFAEHADEPDMLEAVCMLVGAVDLSRSCREGAEAEELLGGVVREALDRLGIASILNIWARGNSAVYPQMPAVPDLSGLTPFEIGRVMRQRHEEAFRERVALRLRPVAAEIPFAITQDQLESVTANIRAFRNEAAGREAWQRLEDDELREVVWGLPVSHLEGVFGISDRGIAKACARRGIASPPRGYWQTLNAGKDPRPVLERNGVRAPDSIMEDLQHRFGARAGS